MLDRKIKPEPSGQIDFKLPDIGTFKLDNQLNVYHVAKSSLPIIQIKLIIPAGNIHCASDKNGLSTLTSMLIDEGAGDLDGLEISSRIEMLGSILNINSNKEYTTISLLSLKENFQESLEIFSLILMKPAFKQIDFEREINRLNSQIIQLNDDPSFLASGELNYVLYKNSPYRFPSNGSIDSIKNISNEDVSNFYKNNYSPSGASLIVVGDISRIELEVFLNKSISKWRNNGSNNHVIYKLNPSKRELILIDKADAAQSEIRVGHISDGRNSNSFYARTIMNSILGGQFSSRINLNLREDKGYTYGANSNYHYNKMASTFAISTSVKSENSADALNEILFELENIKTNISSDEINFSKSYLIRRYPSLFETYSQIATNISLLPIFELDKDYFSKYVNNISKVTSEEIEQCAKDTIHLEKLVIVVVGNKKVIGKQLNNFAGLNNFEYVIKN
ncbi:MAG: insulinase family protein [Melioribacteraceae bacterium]|nr:insulinase family protein [Melioribacteraceae bacterium]